MTLAWQTELRHTEKLVLLALADNANDEGRCFPSVATLMAKCGMTDRGVQKIICRLAELGHLDCHYRTGKSTVYTVHPRTRFTPELSSPPNQIHHAPEHGSPPPPNGATKTPEPCSPIISKKPPVEPSGNLESARKRAHTAQRLPENFELTPERQATARAEAVNPEREFARFCDHWRAASGSNARKHDWDAAWRNWCRKAAEFSTPRNGFKPSEDTGWRPTE